MAIFYDTYPQDEKLMTTEREVPALTKRKLKPIWKVLAVLTTCYLLCFNCMSSGSSQGSDLNVFSLLKNSENSKCPRTQPLSPSFSNSSIHEILNDPLYKKQIIETFSGAIQIETEVIDKNPAPSEDPEFWSQFPIFQQYLVEKFPLTYSTLTLDIVNELGIVLTWEGSQPDLKPLMITAHQDVVPVNPASVDQWTHGPYSGKYDSETDTIWGRGSFDCKNLLIGELQAVEKLIQDGFEPTRTLLVVFGFDEESSGVHGAAHISKFLTEKYGEKGGLYSIVDEGFGIAKVEDGLYIATPITGEKGACDCTFSIKGHGGHSSNPPMSGHTNIGIAAKLISQLEDTPFTANYTPENPVWNLLNCLAEHSTVIKDDMKNAIFKSHTSSKNQQILLDFLVQSKSFKELVRTSQAVDTIQGGVKSNALPEDVSFVVNHRIDVGSSVNATVERDLSVAKEIADLYEYGLKYKGGFILPETENGYIELSVGTDLEPAPVSPHDNSAWKIFSESIQETYENGVFGSQEKKPDFYVSESLATFNTDTKHYWHLTKNIYRFQAVILPENALSVFHSVNEHIQVNDHLSTIAFIYNYVLNVNEYETTD